MKFFTKNIILMFVCVCTINSAAFAVGHLWLFLGPMCAGKTTSLIKMLEQARLNGKRVLVLRHHLFTDKSELCTHAEHKKTLSARLVGEKELMQEVAEGVLDIEEILSMAKESDVIGFDEVQFFSPRMVDIIAELVAGDKLVICSGLDLDFRREPFGKTIPALLKLATSLKDAATVNYLTAFCDCCDRKGHKGVPAPFSQRLVNGEPAPYNDDVNRDGGVVTYEPRCQNCHVCKKEE